ncbi:MAG: NADH dehydrogenase FAD-containing subunit [Deltaproteobacteria bacterium]|jgi:hydrogenase-4 component F|nr:NADH dehydrogenase FAD-containing subunit [Deltaproteobacteria bacterium]
MLAVLVILPFLAGVAAFFIYSDKVRRLLLPLTAAAELALAVCCRAGGAGPLWGVLALDDLGFLVLLVTCLLFFVISFHIMDYLVREGEHAVVLPNRLHFTNVPEAVFTACLLLFLGTAVLVAVSSHLGLLWVAIEGTTLACAPLIYFHRTAQSLEATWKYLIICSVGIAFALLGNFLLDVAWQVPGRPNVGMTMQEMLADPRHVNPAWFKAAFIFIFIGYGAKTGLAPMHSWLPDAHSEAPSPISALLSGALLNCALLGILRLHQLSLAAGFGEFSQELFVIFGLFSMAIAGLFIVGQGDYKRMLAYSSVEHMGVILLGIGLGGLGVRGGLLQLVCHSLAKAALFMLAGNILFTYHSKAVRLVSGLGRVLPWTGALWLAGFFAAAGCPPFGIFTSEFTILRALLRDGFSLTALIYLFSLAFIFAGLAWACLRMFLGQPPASLASDGHTGRTEGGVSPLRERPFSIVSPLVLLALCAVLGVFQPAWFKELLLAAAGGIAGF